MRALRRAGPERLHPAQDVLRPVHRGPRERRASPRRAPRPGAGGGHAGCGGRRDPDELGRTGYRGSAGSAGGRPGPPERGGLSGAAGGAPTRVSPGRWPSPGSPPALRWLLAAGVCWLWLGVGGRRLGAQQGSADDRGGHTGGVPRDRRRTTTSRWSCARPQPSRPHLQRRPRRGQRRGTGDPHGHRGLPLLLRMAVGEVGRSSASSPSLTWSPDSGHFGMLPLLVGSRGHRADRRGRRRPGLVGHRPHDQRVRAAPAQALPDRGHRPAGHRPEHRVRLLGPRAHLARSRRRRPSGWPTTSASSRSCGPRPPAPT